LPDQWLHEPYRMPSELGQRYGVVIGRDYPYPIVDNKQSIRMAKTKMAEHKRHLDFSAISAEIYQKLGSRSRPSAPRKPVAKTHQQYSLF